MEGFDMRLLFYFLLILFCGNVISCKSPTQSDNETPDVTITGIKTTLWVGDTLRLTLHASNSLLTSGYIDFKDSTIILFNNLKPVFDTTLIHIFTSVGSYNITTSFTNGSKTTSKQLNVIVISNPSPVVALIANKTTLNMDLNDTLKIILHASDSTLNNGSLDFKDGTIISFSNLNHTFDTTIMHVYAQLGTYSVTAIFSDGNTSTTSSVYITVQHYYELSLIIGMEWQFAYELTNAGGGGYDHQTGIHTWKIISSSVVNQDTVFTVQVIKNDTLTSSGGSGFSKDTSYFTIIYSYSAIQLTGGSNRYDFEGGNTPFVGGPYTLPNHGFITNYPLIVGDYPKNSWSQSQYFLFEDNIGPTYFYFKEAIAPSALIVTFSLIKFSKP
jgi:hypothetical protein